MGTEEQILRDIKDGKKEAKRRLYDRYSGMAMSVCMRYMGNRDDAADVLQETFIKAYQNLEDFRESSSEKTWLTRIAINTCKDLRRSGWFRHMDRSVTPDMIPEPVAPVEPEEESLTMEIMKLPAKLKEVALLCWLQGMTYCSKNSSVKLWKGFFMDRVRERVL